MAPDCQLALSPEAIPRALSMMPPRAVSKRLSAKPQTASAGIIASTAKITGSAGISVPAGTSRRGAVNANDRAGRGQIGIGGLGIISSGKQRCESSCCIAAAK
jgi:hypothetical protein